MAFRFPNSIVEFRNKFKGVRQNRFMVQVSWPSFLGSGAQSSTEVIPGALTDPAETAIYIKAADIPESQIGIIQVPWQGRQIKFSGERTYVDWSIQIYESNKKLSDLRRNFEIWMEAMDGRNDHAVDYNVTADWKVFYNDMKEGTSESNVVASSPDGSRITKFTRGIRLKHCFPVNVGTLSMDYDMQDSFAIFPVTMAFDFWEPLGDLYGVPSNGNDVGGGGLEG